MFDLYPPSAKQHALNDLTARARGGVIMYLVTWLIAAHWANVAEISPLFYWINTSVLVLLFVLRLIHYLMVKLHKTLDVDWMLRAIVILVLASGLHWGVHTAWILADDAYQPLHYPYMIILAGFAIGGTATLSIFRVISLMYPLVVYGPSISTLLIVETTGEYYLLAGLAIFSMVYIIDSARLSGRDYWRAIRNQLVAEERTSMLERLSHTDPLTELRNRMYFNKQYEEEWKRCDRQKIPLSALMIDLDYFKNINDKYGHLFGDECLRQVAVALQSEVPRTTDTIARYGGEEFVVLLPGTGVKDARLIAQRLVERIAQMKLLHQGSEINVTCSIGVSCTIPDHKKSNQSLLNHADLALYQAKRNGRNRWVVSDQATDQLHSI